MAETIVAEGKVKCRGTIKKGGLSGKECRRTILVKDPELGWGVPCDRCQEFHPLWKVLRDLVESGELDEKEILAAVSEQKENKEEKMGWFPDIDFITIEQRQKNLMMAFKILRQQGHLDGAGGIQEVRYYFTNDGSDYEVDKILPLQWPRRPSDREEVLLTYTPSEKISRRLKNELPLGIEIVFKKATLILKS